MKFEFKLPDIGEGVVEGEIVGWLVNEGDAVAEDQPIAEVLTDKATVEIPSPKAGKVVSLPYGTGDTVPVGSVLIVLEVDSEESAAPEAPAAKSPEPEPTPEPTPAPTPAPTRATVEAPTQAQHRPATVAASGPSTTGRALAAPATRRIARELGVDISTVTGTGKNGRVTKADVERAAGMAPAVAATPATAPTAATTAPAAAAAPQRYVAPTAPSELEERTPLKGLRKAIADNMVKSAFTAPHFTYVEEIDVTDLVDLRKRLRPLAKERGTDFTFLPVIMKAVVAMLKKHPILNASLDDSAQEIVVKHYYNLGIAVATERGLIVPVVKDVDQKGLLELAQEVSDLSAKARKMRLSQDDLTGSTFTITSLGKLGGILATPILNLGEVAILGVHRIIERPMYVNGEVVPRKLMNVSLSFDHRVVDGYDGAYGVQTLREILENPDLLLLEMR